MRDRLILSGRSGKSIRKSIIDIRHPLVISLGFPCQDLSIAGKQNGLSGERSGLWREAARVISQAQPDWIVIENVAHTWRKWVPEVRRDLWLGGYESLPFRIRACEMGAFHERSRIFIVAHSHSEFLWKFERWFKGKGWQMAKKFAESGDFAPRRLGKNDGIPGGMDRRRALGNAVMPQIAQIIANGIKEVDWLEKQKG